MATNQEAETSHSHKDCKLKSYNIEYKWNAVVFAVIHGNRAAAKKFGIAVKRVREWRKQKEKL